MTGGPLYPQQGADQQQQPPSAESRVAWPISNNQWNYKAPAVSFREEPAFPDPAPVTLPPEQRSVSIVPTSPQSPVRQPSQPEEQSPAGQAARRSVVVPGQKSSQLAPGEKADVVLILPTPLKKPRAVIPAYRALSGMISFLVISLLLCGGMGYYLHVNGTWNNVSHLVRGAPQPALTITPEPDLAVPPIPAERGPAFDIIPQATTVSQIRGGMPGGNETVFKTNKIIYLSFVIQAPPEDGTVVIKWFSNGKLIGAPEQHKIVRADGETQQRLASTIFTTAGQGTVELYWNNQLAQKLYFIVRASAS